jgi:diguanylate cyclase (GGDEF)-like protein/PAS domain S-box-containing protein
MAIVGLDGGWLKVNDALPQIIGYTREELLATNFQSLTHPDDLDIDLGLARRLLRREIASYNLEKRYIHKDGHAVTVMLSATLVRASDGTPRFFVAQIQDLTAQKRLEDETKMFFEKSVDMLAISGTSGYLDVVNDTWRRTLGWTAEELTSNPFLDFVHPDDRERTIAQATAVYAGRPTMGFRNRYRTKTGSYRWLEWDTQASTGGRLYSVVRDVTTEHEVTHALQASERRFRRLAEGSLQGIVVVRDEVRCRPLYVNAVAARAFAFGSVEEMLGYPTLGACLAPEPPQPQSTPFHPSRPPLPPRGLSKRVHMRRKDGTWIWVDVLRTPIEWDGSPAVQLTLLDVTEQARLEMSLERSSRIQRAIARHLPMGAVFLFDHRLRYVLADGSSLFESMGLEREAIEGRTVHELVSPAHRDEVIAAYQDALRGLERRLEVSRDGRTFDVLTVPIRNDDGTVIAGMALAYDVTDRKREADELREARTLLATQTETLRTLSHRDPLTGILNRRGFLSAAEELRGSERSAGATHLLLFIDLDGMKPINDSLGHQAGDEALREAAAILEATAGEHDVVARLGGDEFAVFIASSNVAGAAAARIETGLANANAQPERRFLLSMSIGTIPVACDDTRSLETLLDLADARMYEQKKATRIRSATRTSTIRAA